MHLLYGGRGFEAQLVRSFLKKGTTSPAVS